MLKGNVGCITGLLRIAAVVAAVSATGLTCHKAPSGWERTDESTIRLNLAVVDSAGAAYNVQLSTGRRDLAVQEAQAILLGHPGTDTVLVAEDSSVWVYFRNKLVTGLGDLARHATTASSKRRGPPVSRAKAVSGTPGGNIFRAGTFIVPFSKELPGTELEADVIARRLEQLPNWGSSQTYLDSSVTLENVRYLIDGRSPVLFWAGHGVLQAAIGGDQPALMTGKTFDMSQMSAALANEYHDYLASEIETFFDVQAQTYTVIILPGFISKFGNFRAWDVPENGNYSKTLVYLSCCHSAHGTAESRPLLDAFISAGANVTCGWDWAVRDGFAVDKDTAFFRLMCDTFLPFEAYRAMGNKTDPDPVRGKSATFRMRCDSLVMIEPVLFAGVDGVARRAEQVRAETSATGASVTGRVMSQTLQELGKLTVSFPGPAAGTYDFATVAGAKAEWIDQVSGRTYSAQKDYQGVAGSISVSHFAYNVIMAVFSGTLGWWDAGRDPKQDQPDAVVQLDAGRIKFTGKMGADSVAPQETTYHHGYIYADETWSPSGNPHIIDGDVVVSNGAWLTIEPGCVVKFDNFGLGVGTIDSGGLTAVGTSSAPILFTSNKPVPAPGDGGGIWFGAYVLPGTRLSYCTIEYAGALAYEAAAISMGGGGIVDEISNCTIRNNGMYGIFCREYAGFRTFRDNAVTDNLGYALRVDAGRAELLADGNQFSGNDSAGVELYGRLSVSSTWPDLGVPYVVKDVTVGDVTQNPVLTVAPGAEIRFRKDGYLAIGENGAARPGRIVADGSAGRITFTSMVAAPAPGDFYGVSVYEGSSEESEFRNCDFSYGGGSGGDNGLLYVHKSNPVIAGCDFGHSAGYGLTFRTTVRPDTLAVKAVNTFHDNVSGTIKWLMPFPGR